MAKVILQDVRCSYVFVAEQRKKKGTGEDDGWGIQPLIDKDDEAQVKRVKAAIKEAFIAKFGQSEWDKGPKHIRNRYKLPLRDGDEERDTEEYENMYFVNVNSKTRKPGLVNRNNEPADVDDIDDMCYSGAYFHVSVNFYGFESRDGGKPGIAAGLQNVMLRKKGERLDGSVSATSEFSEFADHNGGSKSDDDEDW